MDEDAKRKRKFSLIILAYPIILIVLGLLLNVFLFGIAPAVVALPDPAIIASLIINALLLLVNHTWLMTSTELTRLKYNMYATPEEWEASEHDASDVSKEADQELKRRHNAHNNATENTVYLIFLALLISLVSPHILAAQVWIISFAIGRLGHTYSYLSGKDTLRGISMSISLLSLYGMVSYLIMSLLV